MIGGAQRLGVKLPAAGVQPVQRWRGEPGAGFGWLPGDQGAVAAAGAADVDDGHGPQSMGELVDDLVSKGYLARHEDPADRRAKRIYLTQKGRATATTSKAATRHVEKQLSQMLGAQQYQQMRRDLTAIAALDPSITTG